MGILVWKAASFKGFAILVVCLSYTGIAVINIGYSLIHYLLLLVFFFCDYCKVAGEVTFPLTVL